MKGLALSNPVLCNPLLLSAWGRIIFPWLPITDNYSIRVKALFNRLCPQLPIIDMVILLNHWQCLMTLFAFPDVWRASDMTCFCWFITVGKIIPGAQRGMLFQYDVTISSYWSYLSNEHIFLLLFFLVYNNSEMHILTKQPTYHWQAINLVKLCQINSSQQIWHLFLTVNFMTYKAEEHKEFPLLISPDGKQTA